MIVSSVPFGDEIGYQTGDDSSSIQDLVGVDQSTEDQSVSEEPLPDSNNASPTAIQVTAAVTKAAFLVTNWLVGEGER
jgi:hypothetical protein